jgi:hypothetical protein
LLATAAQREHLPMTLSTGVIARLDRGNPVLTVGVYWIARSSRAMTAK